MVIGVVAKDSVITLIVLIMVRVVGVESAKNLVGVKAIGVIAVYLAEVVEAIGVVAIYSAEGLIGFIVIN